MIGKPHRRFVALFIGILMGALCLQSWLRGASDPGPASADPAATRFEKEDADVATESPSDTTTLSPIQPPSAAYAASIPDLPSDELPLRDQLPALLARAQAGDPVAVCRLALDLNRCTEERRKMEFNERMIRSLGAGEGPHDELMITTVVRTREQLTAAGRHCEGVDTSSLPSPASLLEQGVVLSPHQKAILALMRPDGRIQRLHGESSYSESALYVYPQFLADNAYRFLQEGFQAADLLALEGLILVHSPSGAVSQKGVALSMPDPRRFLTYLELLRRLQGDVVLDGNVGLGFAEARASLTSVQWEAIEREVERELVRWNSIPTSGGTPSMDASGQTRERDVDCNR